MAKRPVEQLPPPWMQGAQKINDQDMLVVHMNNGELEGLDNLQGGPSIDSNTGIREYSALGPIIDQPDIQQLFHHIADEVDQHGDISPDMQKIYHTAKEHSLPYRETPDEEHNPLKAMEKTGVDGDTKLAFIPLNLAYLLIELRHVPSINPKTGLLMFGWFENTFVKPFKNVVRIAGTVGGAMIAGPLGAGIGRGLAGLATGQKGRDAFRSGLNHMGRTALVSGIGGAVNAVAPGIGASMGSYLPASMSSAAGNFFTGPMSTMGMLGSAGNALGFGSGAAGAAGSQMAGAAAHGPGALINPATGALTKAAAAGQAAASGAGTGLSSILGNAMKLAPLGVAALGYMGSKHKHKQDMQHHADDEAKIERERERAGFNQGWEPLKKGKRRVNPAYMQMSPEEMEYGYLATPAFLHDDVGQYAKGGVVKYNKGTLVKGPGKGQADLIKTSVPEGTYIIDASSTSAFGDGSSSAGGQVLKQFENQIKRKYPQKFVQQVETLVKKQARKVPVWLSNDEYGFDPVAVTLLGKGSNAKGAEALKAAVIKLRKHKISKGDELPPKAKHPSYYIPKGRF